jgi:excinuclease ABC subunit A
MELPFVRGCASVASVPPSALNNCIRLRGVHQNNLKGFDLDLPLGRYIVVTGLSGAGKSSLVFDTLHAEGQRRYVETFSAYTRQFLDLLPKPRVDSIENIRPSIAIQQTNTVKTSRSTVGTMTELTDFFKVWFSHVAECFDPETGEKVEDDHPSSIWQKARSAHPQATVVVAFQVTRPDNLSWSEILKNLKTQSYVRVLVPTPPDSGRTAATDARVYRVDDLLAQPRLLATAAHVFVAQDRVHLTEDQRSRFLEAAETALHFGHGEVRLFREMPSGHYEESGHYSRGLHSPKTGRTFRAATPALFSFNSPLGACPQCRGFGRIIDVDYRLAIPDHSLSLDAGAIKPWEGEIYGESKRDLYRFAKKLKIPTDVPFASLTAEQKDFVVNGDPDYDKPGKTWPHAWYGLKGFFRYFETKTYKMHVRVFLSRYRAYNRCPACGGARLQPEALCRRWRGRTLPQLYQLPVTELVALIEGESAPSQPSARLAAHSADLAHESIITRLRYLQQVGLGYLTLDRASRTLSGGEVERVNLTSCLGTSLVDTLFVLDEPSVGLHPRDINRLIGIIRSLTNAGNTVLVVEHDEAMIRAADQVVEIGPEAGARGGQITFQGSVDALLLSPASITGAYLSGRRKVELPPRRRPVQGSSARAAAPGESPKWLRFANVTKHNVSGLTFRLPLERLVCLSGVSGSGKSTLLDNVIYQGLLAQRLQPPEDPASIGEIQSDLDFADIVLVDQSPVSRTPRSNPALYSEAWELIRELYAATPAAQEAGFSASSFSFNTGDGRCEHCQGLGYERIEMQFLSDVFVPCAVCEGRRFKPEALAITWNGRSVADLLDTTISGALPLFEAQPEIQRRLAVLAEVGLGYLTLGQPLNTLSGGEAQRLKLVRYLGNLTEGRNPKFQTPNPKLHTPNSKRQALPSASPGGGALLLLDEPTTGLHKHDVKRLLAVLQTLVDRGHSVVVIEHQLDVLLAADWIFEVGPGAGPEGGRIVAEGTPEDLARADTATSPFIRAALDFCHLIDDKPSGAANSAGQYAGSNGSPPALIAAEDAARYENDSGADGGHGELVVFGARENNLKNLTVAIPHHQLSVVTGVSGSGKSTLAFDIVFAEGQRRFMESMSPYARQFVEQLPRPAVDRLTGIPPTVAIEQRVTRGSRKSTVATITEVAQYLRLLYARLGVQHHPESDRTVTPLTPAQLRLYLGRTLASSAARRARHLYLCAPLIRGRKGHHQPIATWLARQGHELMRIDGRLLRVEDFQKLDRYKEHDIEVVVADLKRGEAAPPKAAGLKPEANSLKLMTAEGLRRALQLGKGACFLLSSDGTLLSWFSTTRTDRLTGESFPELDPKHFSFNSPRGWCPACRGHGRIYDWMLEPREDEELPPEIADLARRIDPDVRAPSGTPCPACHGERLNRVARAVKLHFRTGPPLSLPALLRLPPAGLLARLRQLALDARGRAVTMDLIPQIEERLKFLDHVGLGYLSLDRPTETLSGGEAQRIRLAAQLGSNLSGVLYVLDEPSIGLHARDNERLIGTLETLRDKGNTLLVVEHDEIMMERADRIIDLGPGAGTHGGELIANDTPANLKRNQGSLTGLYLGRGLPHPSRGAYREIPSFKFQVPSSKSQSSSSREIPNSKPQIRREVPNPKFQTPRKSQFPSSTARNSEPRPYPLWLTLTGARYRNLRNVDLRLPLGRLIMVCGPSGAGKSTLFDDLLRPAVSCAIKARRSRLTGREFAKTTGLTSDHPGPARREPGFDELLGAQLFKSVIEVDQAPIGQTPRSTPATYLGIFDLIRQFFAGLPEAKIRGYTASRFSFNTTGGRCATCQGAGRVRLEMAFMPDAYLPCDDCGGLRYGPDVADIAWKGRNIGQVLQLTFEEAARFFDFHAKLGEVCRLMVDCGLGYLTLGQSSPTLSGGEAQRLKLVSELARGLQTYTERTRGVEPQNLYLLEEPTIGLHLSDCEKLIRVLHGLVDQGHTVVVIEHHLDLLAEADYLVELGPGGGPAGGQILYQGPLAGLLNVRRSPTAPYLRAKLAAGAGETVPL